MVSKCCHDYKGCMSGYDSKWFTVVTVKPLSLNKINKTTPTYRKVLITNIKGKTLEDETWKRVKN